MKRRLILRLPPKSKILVYAQIVWVLIMLWLRDVVGMPSLITYFTDIFTICLLVSHKNHIRHSVYHSGVINQSRILLIMLICMLIGVIVNLVSPLLILWAVRNNLRFYAFFYVCISTLTLSDVDKFFAILKTFFCANIVMTSYQYFIIGLSGDNIGGFFGVAEGCNGYLIILIYCVMAIVISEYFYRKIGLWKLIFYLTSAIFMTWMGELKIVYVVLVLMIMLAAICVKPTVKTITMSAMCAVSIGIAFYVMWIIDARVLSFFVEYDALEYYLFGNGYTNSGDLNRFSAISQIYSRFFEGNLIQSLFGFGFGSCEGSQFEFLQSTFFVRYKHLHYRWFTHAWVYLEQGAFGLILLIVYFASIFVTTFKIKEGNRSDIRLTALLFVATCFVSIVYNCVLQLECCYIIAFMCALPFVLIREK